MKDPLLYAIVALFVLVLGGLALALIRGRVAGTHPVHKRVAWIHKTEHPQHYWGYTLLHVVLLGLLALLVLGIWSSPAF